MLAGDEVHLPAPELRAAAAGQLTTSRPSPSIPAATPLPPDHDTGARERVEFAERRHFGLTHRQGALELAQGVIPYGIHVVRGESQRPGGRLQLAGQPPTALPTLTPTPSTAQPSCGRPSARIPATLRPPTQHVVRPLDLSAGAARSVPRPPRRERRTGDRQVGEADQRRAARWRRPGPALPPAAGRPPGGRPPASQVRRARGGKLSRARSLVDRVERRCRCGAPSSLKARPDADLVVQLELQQLGRRSTIDRQRERPIGILVAPSAPPAARRRKPSRRCSARRSPSSGARAAGRRPRAPSRSTLEITLPNGRC